MTKPKLTDAVKPANTLANSDNTKPAADGAGSSGDGSGTGADDSAGGDKGSDDDGSGDAAGETAKNDDGGDGSGTGAETTPTTPAAKTVSDFRTTFGHEQGSVYFADGLDYATACERHVVLQAKQITTLQAENAELKKLGAAMAKNVLGESEPVTTKHDNEKSATTDKRGQFEENIAAKLEKIKH